jgi:hypothetical protein
VAVAGGNCLGRLRFTPRRGGGTTRGDSARSRQLGTAALELLTVLIFATRDILFLQWCDLTHMKRPLVKGFLYLCLYYVSVSIIGGVISIGSDARASLLFQLFTPFGVFHLEGAALSARPGLYIGMGLQLLIILGILKAIVDRLRAPAAVTAASAA